MKLSVVAVGHRLPDWQESGFNEYARRMPRDMLLTLTELKPEARRDEPGSSVWHAGVTTRVTGRSSSAVPTARRHGLNLVPTGCGRYHR